MNKHMRGEVHSRLHKLIRAIYPQIKSSIFIWPDYRIGFRGDRKANIVPNSWLELHEVQYIDAHPQWF